MYCLKMTRYFYYMPLTSVIKVICSFVCFIHRQKWKFHFFFFKSTLPYWIWVLLELFPLCLVLVARLHLKEGSLNSFCLRERNLHSRDIFVDYFMVNVIYTIVLYNNGGECWWMLWLVNRSFLHALNAKRMLVFFLSSAVLLINVDSYSL